MDKVRVRNHRLHPTRRSWIEQLLIGVQLLLLSSSGYAQTTQGSNVTGSSFEITHQSKSLVNTLVTSSSSPATSTIISSRATPTRKTNATESVISNSGTNNTDAGTVNVESVTAITVSDTDGTAVTATPTSPSNHTEARGTPSLSSPTGAFKASASTPLEAGTGPSPALRKTEASSNMTAGMTTAGEMTTFEINSDPTVDDVPNSTTEVKGIMTESFTRLVIIAGATAGSCLVLLIITFIIIMCCHKKQQRRKNSRYYEFKKKDYGAKYERVEQRNSLARRHQPENTPIGGGWVFNSSDHGEFDDDTTETVALRAVAPLAVATPLLKVLPTDDFNGVPDSGHGGSIPPDEYAVGGAPSLDEDIEMEVNPLYAVLGTSVGTGSEARDHSNVGDSDTISEGNEPIAPNPIRDGQFSSLGSDERTANGETVEL